MCFSFFDLAKQSVCEDFGKIVIKLFFGAWVFIF